MHLESRRKLLELLLPSALGILRTNDVECGLVERRHVLLRVYGYRGNLGECIWVLKPQASVLPANRQP